MSEQDDIAGLVRAVRARVPMDAAQMLVKETPERIRAVFAELPQILVDRIKAYLPPGLQLQALEPVAEVIENTVGEMMDPALAVLPQTTTVQEAIAFLRNHITPQQITYLYVTDAHRRLEVGGLEGKLVLCPDLPSRRDRVPRQPGSASI